MLYSTRYLSPIGLITIASNDTHIVGVWIEGQKYFLETVKEEITEKNDLPILKLGKDWLNKYFYGKNPDISDLQLAPKGSEFRKYVWKILCEIPYGELNTYGNIAKRMAKEMNKPNMSSQAIGGAIGHNPISIIIPCHRVVGTNGNLTGYAGGVDKKAKLLKLEGVDMSSLVISAN